MTREFFLPRMYTDETRIKGSCRAARRPLQGHPACGIVTHLSRIRGGSEAASPRTGVHALLPRPIVQLITEPPVHGNAAVLSSIRVSSVYIRGKKFNRIAPARMPSV